MIWGCSSRSSWQLWLRRGGWAVHGCRGHQRRRVPRRLRHPHAKQPLDSHCHGQRPRCHRGAGGTQWNRRGEGIGIGLDLQSAEGAVGLKESHRRGRGRKIPTKNAPGKLKGCIVDVKVDHYCQLGLKKY